ncbi:MAG: hypothetical protein JOS17DRAFT_846236 [Linnemannia elongata]|nr:MAG: hypothetical protein JOS17DRAFT_846236 [Linnemannia elongata]
MARSLSFRTYRHRLEAPARHLSQDLCLIMDDQELVTVPARDNQTVLEDFEPSQQEDICNGYSFPAIRLPILVQAALNVIHQEETIWMMRSAGFPGATPPPGTPVMNSNTAYAMPVVPREFFYLCQEGKLRLGYQRMNALLGTKPNITPLAEYDSTPPPCAPQPADPFEPLDLPSEWDRDDYKMQGHAAGNVIVNGPAGPSNSSATTRRQHVPRTSTIAVVKSASSSSGEGRATCKPITSLNVGSSNPKGNMIAAFERMAQFKAEATIKIADDRLAWEKTRWEREQEKRREHGIGIDDSQRLCLNRLTKVLGIIVLESIVRMYRTIYCLGLLCALPTVLKNSNTVFIPDASLGETSVEQLVSL